MLSDPQLPAWLCPRHPDEVKASFARSAQLSRVSCVETIQRRAHAGVFTTHGLSCMQAVRGFLRAERRQVLMVEIRSSTGFAMHEISSCLAKLHRWGHIGKTDEPRGKRYWWAHE